MMILARRRYQRLMKRIHRAALHGLGLGNWDPHTNGEYALLRRMAADWRSPTLIDAGAFLGAWTEVALEACPSAKIHVLEPNAASFRELNAKLGGRALLHNVGISDEPRTQELLAPPEMPDMGSLHRRDLSRFDWVSEPEPVGTVELTTLDRFCEENGISRVDFLKLDVEGHEVAALDGAGELLAGGAIEAIQFEFGGANVDSRTYLRDLFDRLSPGYSIHRIVKDGVVEVGYQEDIEIFVYSNFVALRRPGASTSASAG